MSNTAFETANLCHPLHPISQTILCQHTVLSSHNVGSLFIPFLQDRGSHTMPFGDEVNGLLKRPLWVPDSATLACESCGGKFSATNRRHHCRVCGCVFCRKCCVNKVHIPSLGYTSPQLVCAICLRSAPSVVGMTVQVCPDIAVVRRLCTSSPSLPPWEPRKAAFCGCIGKIDKQDPRDGSVKVCFPNGPFSWYPPSCLAIATAPLSQPSEVETRYVITCPSKPYLEGAYSRLSEKVNKVSVWAMTGCRLYSNSLGNWAVTVSPEGMEKEQGVVRSRQLHSGKLHPYSMSLWETYKEGRWTLLSDFAVYKANVPTPSVPCVNSALRYVQPLPNSAASMVPNPSSVPSSASPSPTPSTTLAPTASEEAAAQHVDPVPAEPPRAVYPMSSAATHAASDSEGDEDEVSELQAGNDAAAAAPQQQQQQQQPPQQEAKQAAPLPPSPAPVAAGGGGVAPPVPTEPKEGEVAPPPAEVCSTLADRKLHVAPHLQKRSPVPNDTARHPAVHAQVSSPSNDRKVWSCMHTRTLVQKNVRTRVPHTGRSAGSCAQ